VDCFAHKLVRHSLATGANEDVNFHFADKNDEARESVPALPNLPELRLEQSKKRAQLKSFSVEIEIEIPPGLQLSGHSQSRVMVYERYMTHWFQVRRIPVDEQNLKQTIELRNVSMSDHFVVDIRL